MIIVILCKWQLTFFFNYKIYRAAPYCIYLITVFVSQLSCFPYFSASIWILTSTKKFKLRKFHQKDKCQRNDIFIIQLEYYSFKNSIYILQLVQLLCITVCSKLHAVCTQFPLDSDSSSFFSSSSSSLSPVQTNL